MAICFKDIFAEAEARVSFPELKRTMHFPQNWHNLISVQIFLSCITLDLQKQYCEVNVIESISLHYMENTEEQR